MKMGIQASKFADSIGAADVVLLYDDKSLQWDLHANLQSAATLVLIKPDIAQLIEYLTQNSRKGDQIVIMSNGGFANIHRQLIDAMQCRLKQ